MSAFSIVSIIDKKRRGYSHDSQEEIDWLIQGIMTNTVNDYQVSAWLMAVCINGLSDDETFWLTQALVNSGQTVNWPDTLCPVIDKHSTGGVGDKTTLVLIPLLAAAGVNIAKLSGRSLGHTGGTIDKFEAIPGFKTQLSMQAFIHQVKQHCMAIASATADLAPADGKLYALRDVTATVESIPLIAASVVSKKIAAGAHTIVLDIKYGSGAFMKDLQDAKKLAETCRMLGRRFKRPISTVISVMETPLGTAVGNSLEVIEAIELLKGRGQKDLLALCLKLGAVALVSSKKAKTPEIPETIDSATALLQEKIESGDALKAFGNLISAQGGNQKIIADYTLLPQANSQSHAYASQAGCVSGINALSIAQAANLLGVGRHTKEDAIDPSAGIVLTKQIGDFVFAGSIVAVLHHDQSRDAGLVQKAKGLVQRAFFYSDKAVNHPDLIEAVVLAD
ncbi:MAG: thymidine phosphorylase [Cyanobacteria bacterium P01_H01_bin.74]